MPAHLSIPIRLVDGALATVEQDTVEEIAQNVQVLAETPVGFFLHDPELGHPDPLFTQLPIQTDAFEQAVAEQEPRAVLGFTGEPDDAMIALGKDRLGVNVSLAEAA